MYGGFDYYTILGIDHYATRSEVKQAYRRLAKKHHPDLNPNDPTAEEQFQKVNEAYETLYDSSKRKMYDTGFDQTVRTAYASGTYGASDGPTQNFTQSGYGYTDFGSTESNVKFEDLSFSGKIEAYSKFAFKNLPKLHFVVLASLGIFLFVLPIDKSLSIGSYTGISMRLTFFITHAIFSSLWVEKSCHNLKGDFMMLPTMLIFTHGASTIPAAMMAFAVQLFIGLPKYLTKLWSGVEVSDLNF